jgi:hypothetical protein
MTAIKDFITVFNDFFTSFPEFQHHSAARPFPKKTRAGSVPEPARMVR